MNIKVLDKMVSRFDGWQNLFTGLGRKGVDKRMDTQYDPPLELAEDDLINIYRADGMGTRIIDVFTEDMTRKWFKVTGDTDSDFDKDLRSFKGKQSIIECLRWALLMGGSVGVMGVDDGGTYETPVNEGAIRKITHIHAFDRWRTIWTTADLYQDPNNPLFGTPEFYTIYPINPAGTMAITESSQRPGTNSPTIGAFRVHETRVLRFDGKNIPMKARIRQRYWNDSYLMACYERIRGLGEGYASIENILGEFIIGTLTIDNLQNLLASGKESIVTTRMALLDRCKRAMSTKLLDTNEKYERVSSTVSGLDTLIDKLVEGASCASGIPVTRLVGRSPAGMNATGDSDESIYYDKVSGMQESILLPPLERLLRYVMLARETKFKCSEDSMIEFLPLKALDELQQATLRKTQADTDAVYINTGVVSAGEIAESRFGGDVYSTDTHLTIARDENGEIPLTDEELAMQEAQLNGMKNKDEEGDQNGNA
jgi:uncharacterized protein